MFVFDASGRVVVYDDLRGLEAAMGSAEVGRTMTPIAYDETGLSARGPWLRNLPSLQMSLLPGIRPHGGNRFGCNCWATGPHDIGGTSSVSRLRR